MVFLGLLDCWGSVYRQCAIGDETITAQKPLKVEPLSIWIAKMIFIYLFNN